MSKIPTAKKLFQQQNPQDGNLPEWAEKFAIDFAKLHVNAALKKAADEATADVKYQSMVF